MNDAVLNALIYGILGGIGAAIALTLLIGRDPKHEKATAEKQRRSYRS